MSARPWTVAHRREALRRRFELMALAVIDRIEDLNAIVCADTTSEKAWRIGLAYCFDEKRIEREVRRVRGLAEGRLVRETVWRARDPQWAAGNIDHEGGSDPRADALSTIKGMGKGWRLVKVTRIRRAVPQ